MNQYVKNAKENIEGIGELWVFKPTRTAPYRATIIHKPFFVIIGMIFEPTALDPIDGNTLGELIKVAAFAAFERAVELGKERMIE